MDELTYLPAVALARAIRDREVSAAEVVDAHLARIAAVNPQINAVVQLAADTARDQARAADDAQRRGEPLGPLHGVPFTVKDVMETAGIVCASGLPERASFVPERDATVVARLRAAGAILLGKTNVPTGGGGIECSNAVYGRTSNPYALDRTPGGSSGGEAAIIAAGGSPLGLGSDSGGSIRLPAHDCGIAGLRPTVGRVPATRAGHFGDMNDHRTQVGLLARSVADLALAFPLIAGVDGHDASVVPMPLEDPSRVDLARCRVAFYVNDRVSAATPATVAGVRAAAEALAKLGATVEEQTPPEIARAWDLTRDVWRWHLGQLAVPDAHRLFARWSWFRTSMLGFLSSWDVVLCPVAACPAVLHGETADYSQASMLSYSVAYSLTGWPCVVVRAATSPEQLPIGVQVVARPWREDVALAAAQQLELALGGWRPPPL